MNSKESLKELYKKMDLDNRMFLYGYGELDHKFGVTEDSCSVCGTTHGEIAGGFKSWVCSGKKDDCYHSPVWRYDVSQWKCSRCGDVLSNDPNYAGRYGYPCPASSAPLKKCTCGSEKAGFNTHTHWCDIK